MNVQSVRGMDVGLSELDSHADTTAAGLNMIMLDDPDDIIHHVNVLPFSNEYEPISDIPIARCATAWTDPETGKVWILVFNQALYFGDKLQNSLICPNQVRSHAFNTVEDTPRQFDPQSKHGITFLSDQDDTTLFIPLQMNSVISYFPSRLPTEEELRTCDYVVATSDFPWDPYSESFETAEDAMNSSNPREVKAVTTHRDNMYDTTKLRYLQKLVTNNTLTPCSVAADGMLFHRLSSVHRLAANRGDQRAESANDEDSRFNQPVLAINALHTPLYERAITDGLGHVELPADANEVVNISSIFTSATEPGNKRARDQLQKDMRARKRRLL